MLQALLTGPRTSRLDTVKIPVPGDNEVLVKVRMSGICASELHGWEHGTNEPVALGHEVAGEVVTTGRLVTGFRPGDR